MKKRILSLLMFFPFFAQSNETLQGSDNQLLISSIIKMKKSGVDFTVERLPIQTKLELLKTISVSKEKANPVESLDLRNLEEELKSSINQTY
ncbi:MAG: hypothetical protein ACXVCP_16220 [Bdellovibrio sp.]